MTCCGKAKDSTRQEARFEKLCEQRQKLLQRQPFRPSNVRRGPTSYLKSHRLLSGRVWRIRQRCAPWSFFASTPLKAFRLRLSRRFAVFCPISSSNTSSSSSPDSPAASVPNSRSPRTRAMSNRPRFLRSLKAFNLSSTQGAPQRRANNLVSAISTHAGAFELPSASRTAVVRQLDVRCKLGCTMQAPQKVWFIFGAMTIGQVQVLPGKQSVRSGCARCSAGRGYLEHL